MIPRTCKRCDSEIDSWEDERFNGHCAECYEFLNYDDDSEEAEQELDEEEDPDRNTDDDGPDQWRAFDY